MLFNPTVLCLPVHGDLLGYSHGRTGPCGPSLPRNWIFACAISGEVASCSISSIKSPCPSKPIQPLASSILVEKGLPGPTCR